MKLHQAAKARRLPGEVAFDRCFFSLVAFSVLSGACEYLVTGRGSASRPLTEAELAAQVPAPGWQVWIPFGLGLLGVALWIRALISLVRAWRDPSARVVRISALVLLAVFGFAVGRLLWSPFR